MSHVVRIESANAGLKVGNDTTILSAALEAGIAYPHGCRAGRCGACKSRLVSGEVELLRHTPFALTPDERQAGLILACRAQPRSDCAVAWLEDQRPARDNRPTEARAEAIDAGSPGSNTLPPQASPPSQDRSTR